MNKMFENVEDDNSVESELMGLIDDLSVTEYNNLSDEGKVIFNELHNLIIDIFKNKGVK